MESATSNPLIWTAIACAVISTGIIGWYLVARPELVRSTKVLLFFGLTVFPVGTAMTGNFVGYTTSQKRTFCGSCHVMTPYTEDSEDPKSSSLASTHARNVWFGEHNCYTCHSDYGMFGTVATKLTGLNHVYEYYLNYRDTPIPEALKTIHLYKPFTNTACLRCHSTELKGWDDVEDHRGLREDVRTGAASCASDGCHGPAHPFSKAAKPTSAEVTAP